MAKAKEPTNLKSKLSRKIAELTMVVHLLFTRNHEREVEIEALKSVYSKEIKKIEGDVRSKVSWLEGQLEELEKTRVMLDVKNTEISKHKQQTQMLLDREMEMKKELDDKIHLLSMAQKDVIKLRDQLVSKASYNSEQSAGVQQLKEEILRLNKSNEDLSSKLSSKSKKHKDLLKQIDELQTNVKSLNMELKEALTKKDQLETLLGGQQNDWQNEIDKLQSEISELIDCQQGDQEKYTKLEMKNKQLQLLNNELAGSNKQLSMQIQQLINDKNRKKEMKKIKPKQASPEAPRCSPAYEKDEELERLRREVQRYRLEISNRESNFNRVFAEQKPVLTDGRSKKSGNSPDSARFPNLTGTRGRSAVSGQISPSHLPSLK
ncbi:CAP-Gly domain-containing linker protein 1 [Exaiptasia diaphana]|uniref:Uncharacterized protein n=1 Tax=Exaiptasia diaphana TaxID=2652724 RepID=A0A913Y916_EXADI|nr:CAP-Gly domain-containing linker protein 1 [Exaiptasia diaphana]KXJ28906.1 hypothetical protein AC249_AIPGENE4051 [Exaiptasia diaphana]